MSENWPSLRFLQIHVVFFLKVKTTHAENLYKQSQSEA